MLSNNRDLRHDILPYTRDIREEEQRKKACDAAEARECESPITITSAFIPLIYPEICMQKN
jgi:hypothetical protein